MIKQEFYHCISHIINMESDRGPLSFSVLTGKEQVVVKEEFMFSYDTRLDQEKYRNSSITILVNRKSTGKSVFLFTLFFFPYELYKDECFWKAENTILRKEYLEKYKDKLGDWLLCLGYARFSNEELNTKRIGVKANCINVYTKLVKEIMDNKGLPVYVEVAGVEELSKELIKMKNFKVSELPDNVLGRINPESNTTYKFAEWIGLKRFDNIYHIYTLGPVYIIGPNKSTL